MNTIASFIKSTKWMLLYLLGVRVLRNTFFTRFIRFFFFQIGYWKGKQASNSSNNNKNELKSIRLLRQIYTIRITKRKWEKMNKCDKTLVSTENIKKICYAIIYFSLSSFSLSLAAINLNLCTVHCVLCSMCNKKK